MNASASQVPPRSPIRSSGEGRHFRLRRRRGCAVHFAGNDLPPRWTDPASSSPRNDSLWSQIVAVGESGVSMAGNRGPTTWRIADAYRADYAAVFTYNPPPMSGSVSQLAAMLDDDGQCRRGGLPPGQPVAGELLCALSFTGPAPASPAGTRVPSASSSA